MTTFAHPHTHRGTLTRWLVNSPAGLPARITRSIDTDGDESWSVDLMRNSYWTPAPKYSGRNKEAADKIRIDLDCVLYEREELPPGTGELSRVALRVGGTNFDWRDDGAASMVGFVDYFADTDR